MGDPETEVVIPRIKSDLAEMFVLASERKLSDYKLIISNQVASTVIMVSGGYPEEYEKGKIINGLADFSNVVIFHSGTKRIGSSIVTAGGRVLALTALSDTMAESLSKSYKVANKVNFEGKYFRKDIGNDLKHFKH